MADLFDIVTARKLSGGGGGGTTVEALSVTQNGTYAAPSGKAYSPVTVNVSGGSSDFSTAKLTIANTTQQIFSWECPWIVDDPELSCSYGDITVGGTATGTFDIIMYKGMASIHAPKGAAQLSLSGDIEDDGDNYYLITGDCAITIS